jgi:cell division protein ZapA
MKGGRPVGLRIAGQSFKVVGSASEEELHRLAAVVRRKVEELTPPGKAVGPQAIVLAAIALAHELEEERARQIAVAAASGDLLRRVLDGFEDAISCASEQ